MRQKMTFLTLIFAFAGFAPNAGAVVPASERAALIDIYNNTAGAGWTNSTGWMGASGTECSWHGVTCNASQTNVTGIVLYNNNLSGQIPASIGNLTALENLNIFMNSLSGALPDAIGTLTSLRTLSLSLNSFSGHIPVSLGNLSNLQEMYLNQNQFSDSIPSELGNLANLVYLDLSRNQLTGEIPASLGDLSNVQIIKMQGNQLSGQIPATLGNLTKITDLVVSENLLKGEIPSELGNLTTLVDNRSNFMVNTLFTDDTALRDFLNTKQVGGDWESSQAAPMDLSDAVLVLRVLAGLEGLWVRLVEDVNSDGRIDLAEAVFILQKECGLR